MTGRPAFAGVSARSRSIRNSLTLSALVAGVLPFIAAACSGDAGTAAPTLRITAISDHSKDELRERGDAFAVYLGQQLGVAVKFDPVESYQAAVTAIVSGNADVAWLGGVTTVQAMQLSGGDVQPLVIRASELDFKSHFIARADSGITSLDDLREQRPAFSFGSHSSTSGHLMPRHFLLENGIVPEETFTRIVYSGAHDRTIENVAAGITGAGAVNYLTWQQAVADGRVDTSAVDVFWTTPSYVDYSWSARTDIDARFGDGTRETLAESFTRLDPADATHAAILSLQGAQRYIRAEADMWDGIAAVMERVDLGSGN